jgi:hypothetical protein
LRTAHEQDAKVAETKRATAGLHEALDEQITMLAQHLTKANRYLARAPGKDDSPALLRAKARKVKVVTRKASAIRRKIAALKARQEEASIDFEAASIHFEAEKTVLQAKDRKQLASMQSEIELTEAAVAKEVQKMAAKKKCARIAASARDGRGTGSKGARI